MTQIEYKITQDFFLSLKKTFMKYMNDKRKESLFDLNRAIETVYGNNVVGKISKSSFLRALNDLCEEYELPALFEHVVNHLFTPIAWTTASVVEKYALRNCLTGKFVVIKSDLETKEKGRFVLSLHDDPFPLLTTDDRKEMDFILDDLQFTRELDGEELPGFLSHMFKKCVFSFIHDTDDVGRLGCTHTIFIDKDLTPGSLEVVKVKIIIDK